MSASTPPWTTADIPDQSGRLAVITGGNSGIGLEAARALASAGADIILATRSAERSRDAVLQLRAEAPRSSVVREALDLSSLESVDAFAAGRRRDGRPIDLLINNAGIMAVPQRTVTQDGFELQLGSNFLGHFALTSQVLDLVAAARGSRVVTVTSGVAAQGRIRLDDLQSTQRYRAWAAYCQSKLATSMLAVELDRRSRAGDWGIVATAAHPGVAKTNLQATGPRHGTDRRISAFDLITRIPGLSHDAAAGALPTLRAAVDPTAQSGDYYGPGGRLNMVGAPVKATHPSAALDDAVIAGLWREAEALTGASWPAAGVRPARA